MLIQSPFYPNYQKFLTKLCIKLVVWFIPLWLLFNQTSGWSAPLNVGLAPNSVVSADFNGDGFADLAVTNSSIFVMGQLTIYLNNGDGTFRQSQQFTVGLGTASIAVVGDFNGDGHPDIAVLLQKEQQVLIFLNNGQGLFTQQATTLSTGASPLSIAVGNFRGKGKQDLVVANSGDASLSVFFSNGDGTFTTGPTISTPSLPSGVTTGDVDNDGFDDIIATFCLANQVAVFRNNQSGNFSLLGNPYTVGTFPTGVVVGDFNGDGFIDLAVANTMSNNVSVLLNRGVASPGFFRTAVNFSVEFAPIALTVADFNDDGFPDIAVANEASSTVSLLINKGNGTFENAINQPAGSAPISITSGNFTGNIPSYAVANFVSSTITFQPETFVFPPINQRGFQRINQFATQADVINFITWKSPTQGFTPVEFRIFRNRRLTQLAKVVPAANRHKFVDHNRKKNRVYTYFIVSVDASGQQSAPAIVKVFPKKRNSSNINLETE
jgi:hypothetical protein